MVISQESHNVYEHNENLQYQIKMMHNTILAYEKRIKEAENNKRSLQERLNIVSISYNKNLEFVRDKNKKQIDNIYTILHEVYSIYNLYKDTYKRKTNEIINEVDQDLIESIQDLILQIKTSDNNYPLYDQLLLISNNLTTISKEFISTVKIFDEELGNLLNKDYKKLSQINGTEIENINVNNIYREYINKHLHEFNEQIINIITFLNNTIKGINVDIFSERIERSYLNNEKLLINTKEKFIQLLNKYTIDRKNLICDYILSYTKNLAEGFNRYYKHKRDEEENFIKDVNNIIEYMYSIIESIIELNKIDNVKIQNKIYKIIEITKVEVLKNNSILITMIKENIDSTFGELNELLNNFNNRFSDIFEDIRDEYKSTYAEIKEFEKSIIRYKEHVKNETNNTTKKIQLELEENINNIYQQYRQTTSSVLLKLKTNYVVINENIERKYLKLRSFYKEVHSNISDNLESIHKELKETTKQIEEESSMTENTINNGIYELNTKISTINNRIHTLSSNINSILDDNDKT